MEIASAIILGFILLVLPLILSCIALSYAISVRRELDQLRPPSKASPEAPVRTETPEKVAPSKKAETMPAPAPEPRTPPPIPKAPPAKNLELAIGGKLGSLIGIIGG
ncbi:MAG: hypothetical protein AAF492_25030, partial [Verrucomicrobiota bacterium]